MNNIVVTLKSNVQVDDLGEMLQDEDGIPLLHDESDVGILTKTHVIQVNQLSEDKTMLITGVVPQSEVFWNLRRNPAPALHAPGDLVWLTIPGDENDEDENEDESEEEFEESENFDEAQPA